MADELLKAFEPHIKLLTLIPSQGGVFEVTVNGELIFSKAKLGRHANAGEVRSAIAEKVDVTQG